MEKLLRPQDEGYTLDNIGIWREWVKVRRGFTCEVCGGLGTDVHECIVTRRDAQGLPDDRRINIFATCNLLVLCRRCHKAEHAKKDSRVYWWNRMCKKYGKEAMLEWYASFEWRTPDRRFMEYDGG